MKSITELAKVALLLIIATLLGIVTGTISKLPINESEPRHISDLSSSNTQTSRKEDLRKIMEHTLANLFKFPESIRFKNSKFEYKRLFRDFGVEIDASKELELASLCGHYSAQNAMGVYGAFQPFYVEISVNNEKQGISGELWFSNDGTIQKMYSLDSKIPLDGDQGEFKKLFSENCGEINKVYMGKFSEYEIGYEAVGVKYYDEALNKLSQYPDVKNTLQRCMQSEASANYCINIEHCQKFEASESDKNEFCSIRDEVCSDNDSPNICEENITAFYKEHSSKNK